MARKSFAFSFDDHETTRKLGIAWARWRYGPDIINAQIVAQDSVTAALRFMRANLAKGEKIGDVWVFSHGSTTGGLLCRLRPGGSSGYVMPREALQFAKTSSDVKALKPFTDKDTGVHLLACNIGKSPASLGAWCAVFPAGKGWACGAKAWLHFGTRRHFHRVPVTFKRNACKSHSRRLVFEPKTRAEFDLRLAEADAFLDSQTKPAQGQSRPCLLPAQAASMKRQLRTNVTQSFEKFHVEIFKQLGEELPTPIQGAKLPADRRAVIDAMWDLWDEMGLALIPLLADRLLTSEQAGRIVGTRSVSDESIKFWLPDQKDWKDRWVVRPQATGRRC